MRRSKTTPPIAFLRQLIFDHGHGLRDPKKGVVHAYTKDLYLQRCEDGRRYLCRLSNHKIQQHFDGNTTYYYCSCPERSTPGALVMIDIDCHRSGTREGAWEFAAHLLEFFSTLYLESSTNGNGVHGYLILDKLGHSPEEVKAVCAHLQEWLVAQSAEFEIEGVEVKGQPPIPKVSCGRRYITYGHLAKLPREVCRFEEWTHTTVLTVDQILSLQIAQNDPGSTISPSDGLQVKRKFVGSTQQKRWITEDQLSLLPVLEQWFSTQQIPDKVGELRITPTDFAQAALLLRFFSLNPNEDETMPYKRIEALWNSLYESKDFSRTYQRNRWKCIRDWFSSSGLLEWIDNTYTFGGSKGTATKWKLSKQFLQFLSELKVNKLPQNREECNKPNNNNKPWVKVKEMQETVRPVLAGSGREYRDSMCEDGLDGMWVGDWEFPDPEDCTPWDAVTLSPPSFHTRPFPGCSPAGTG